MNKSYTLVLFFLILVGSVCGQTTQIHTFTISPGVFPNEIGWELSETESGTIIFTSGDESLACTQAWEGGNGSGTYSFPLTCGTSYTVKTWDTFGDGWNNAHLTISSGGDTPIHCLSNISSWDADCIQFYAFIAACTEDLISCSNPLACNYEPGALFDVNCVYDCYGCMDPEASNYDPGASIDASVLGENICVYCDTAFAIPIEFHLTNGLCSDTIAFGGIDFSLTWNLAGQDSVQEMHFFSPSIDYAEYHGCAVMGCQTIVSNLEYYQLIGLSELLVLADQSDSTYWNLQGGWNQAFNVSGNSLCFSEVGCTDPAALNFNPWHSIDDGSCSYKKIKLFLPPSKYEEPTASWKLEDMDSIYFAGNVLMFDEPDGSYHIPLPDSGSFRVLLEEVAIFDSSCSSWYLESEDGDIIDQTPGRQWESDGFNGFNYSNWFYLGPGCTDPSAPNFQWGATSDDGSCFTGCTDPSACNYAEWALDDDGSCAYESLQLDVIQGAENHRFWWTFGDGIVFDTFYNNQYNGFPCEQQQMEFNECYHSGCYTFNCSHGSNGAAINHFGNTLHEIQPLQSDWEWNNQAEICLLRPLPICNVSINESSQCVIQWDATDAVPITLNVGVYKLSGTTSEYELIGVVPIEEGSFIDVESAADINPQSYRIARRIINEGESELSDDHKTIHLSANLGVNDNVNLWWNNYEGATYANFQLQRLQPGASEWETFAVVANSTNSYTDNDVLSAQSDYRVVVELPSCEPNFNSSLVETASNVVSLSAVGISESPSSLEAKLIQHNQVLTLNTSATSPVLIELNNVLGKMIWSGVLSNGEILPVRTSPQSIILASYFVDGVAIGSQKIILN